MAKVCRIIFLIFFSSVSLTAQNNDIRFEHLSVNDGLSNNIIWSILQDSREFMWFGTEDGLNKYDGYTFTIYRHDPDDSLSISGNYIRSMYESHYGGNHVLWIGTKSGLNRLDLETEKFTRYPISDDKTGLSNDYITSIYEDNSSELWIGAISGMKRLNRRTGKFIQYQYNPGDPINLSHNNCIVTQSCASENSILWVGTWQGLKKFDCKLEKFIDYKHVYDRMSTLYINWIYPDMRGNLWMPTHNAGLNKFNVETRQYTSYRYDPNNPSSISSNMLGSVVEDTVQGKEVLWLATYNGLDKFDLKTEEFSHYKHNPGNPQSLCNDRIIRVFKDKTGIIWIGTQGGGLSKFDPRQQKFEYFKQEIGNPHGLSDNNVLAIAESKYYGPNIFWIGTINGGLNKYDRNTGLFIHYRHDPHDVNSISNDFVIALLESQFDGRNEIWIGTIYGLNKFDLETNKITRYFHDPDDPHSISDNLIRSICEDNSGNLWIGTRNGGINRFDRATGKFDQQKYHIWEAIGIIEDNTGTIWAGTDLGLFHYNRSTDDFIQYKQDPDDPHNINQNKVLLLYEDKTARLWIGTDNGLILLNRGSNKLFRYTTKDGLSNNVINGILEDDNGHLWLSTNQGLSRFDPLQKTFKNYDMYDGLQSNQFFIGAACLSQKGEMFFGGVNGFNVFHPDSIRDNSHIPDVYLTDFQIFNKEVDVKTGTFQDVDDHYYLCKHISNISEITLSHKESVFSFEFAALDFHSPQKNQYVYKMDGVDPDWVQTNASRRFATYTNLDPGEYVFTVKGSNNDGIWNDEGTSIKIIITPPWWRTRLAYAVYIFFFVLVVYSVWSIQTNRMKMKQQMEQEHFEAEKLREVDKLKSRFFANISHEFRTPLTLIKGPLQQLISGEFKGNIKEQYHTMLRYSDRLLGLINQILDLSKLEAGETKLKVSNTDIIQYIRGLVLSFSSLAERKNIELKFTSAENMLKGYIDKDKLEKILTNLLSNAFKFTHETGNITVNVGIPNHAGRPAKSKIQNFNSDLIELKISNTGPGIPLDQIDKIFDRFYQADDMYKKDGEGTGIGLALTKELVDVCHGEISVSSIPDKTTTFILTLPIGREAFRDDEIIEGPETGDRRPKYKYQI
jgi:two-component system sensor histidine kinase ChiS